VSKVLALFQSVHQVMKVDRACTEAKLPFQIVAVPKEISPECGMAIEIEIQQQKTLEEICRDLGVVVVMKRREDR
jgi:hypothetical protein